MKVRQRSLFGEEIRKGIIAIKKTTDEFIYERVDIYKEQQENGVILKHIKFKFPVSFGDKISEDDPV